MSDFNYQPAFSAQLVKAPRVRSAQFGDGYQQRIADGINNQPESWRLTFNVDNTDADAIESFLEGKGGAESFTWTPKNRTEITVVCGEWSRVLTSPNTSTINATFEQVFE